MSLAINNYVLCKSIVAVMFMGILTLAHHDTEVLIESSESLDAVAVFRDMGGKPFKSETSIHQNGMITIKLRLTDIELESSGSTNLPPDSFRGDWIGEFTVVPNLSKSDVEKISKEMNKFRVTTKGNPTLTVASRNLMIPEVTTKGIAYSVGQSYPGVPLRDSDKLLVSELIRKLSKKLERIDGGNTEDLLRSRFLR